MVLHQAGLLALPITFGLGRALVLGLLTLRDADFDLRHAAMIEVEDQRDKRHALPLGRVPEIREFLAADQQLAAAALFVAEGFGLQVGRDVAVDEPELALLDRRIALGNVGLADAHRFHLRSVKLDPAFDIAVDGIVVPRAPVLGDDLVVRIFVFLCHGMGDVGGRAVSV